MILYITLHQKEKMMKNASFMNLGAEEKPDLSNYNVLLIQFSKVNP